MFTSTRSWNTGSRMAPPSMMTFCPPRPVRTKAVSLVERLYKRENTMPMVRRASRPMPAIAPISIRLLIFKISLFDGVLVWLSVWLSVGLVCVDAAYISAGCGLAMQR